MFALRTSKTRQRCFPLGPKQSSKVGMSVILQAREILVNIYYIHKEDISSIMFAFSKLLQIIFLLLLLRFSPRMRLCLALFPEYGIQYHKTCGARRGDIRTHSRQEQSDAQDTMLCQDFLSSCGYLPFFDSL